MVEDLENDGVVEEFDINDPSIAAALGEYVPDVDTSEVPKQVRMAPPPDGYHWAIARLAPRKGGSVYIKGTRINGKIVDGKVVAAIDCRVWDDEAGKEMGFLRTWYPTSQQFPGQKGSQLTAFCLVTGNPLKQGAGLPIIKSTVERIFAEAGEGGIKILVKTRWIKSVPKAVEVQPGSEVLTYVLDANGNKIYDEIKGEKKIKAAMALKGVPEDQAHLFKDPVTEEDRSVMAEVVSIEDPNLIVSE